LQKIPFFLPLKAEMHLPKLRSQEVHRLQSTLNRDSYPRLQMALLVSITGAACFLASYVLLSSGLLVMWLRYLAAFGIAYLVFLGLLWVWMRTSAKDYADVDPSGLTPGHDAAGSADAAFCGKGGSFDGGGASGNYESMPTPANSTAFETEGDSSIGDTVGAVCEADELAIPLIAILFLAGLILSSLWVVYAAPLLFAELLVDGVLAASLYRRLRGLESRHWLETAVRRTALPFVLTAIVLAGAGAGMQHYAPQAHTMMQAWSQAGLHKNQD